MREKARGGAGQGDVARLERGGRDEREETARRSPVPRLSWAKSARSRARLWAVAGSQKGTWWGVISTMLGHHPKFI